MQEQKEKSNAKNQKLSYNIMQTTPKGCFQVANYQKYLKITNFIKIKEMYSIVIPFQYQLMSFVIARKKHPVNGQILEVFHEASRKSIFKAIPKTGQFGSKYQIYCQNSNKIIARFRGDLMNSKYFLFDGGYNPSKKKFPSRKELAYIYMSNNQFFSLKPATLIAVLANYGKRVNLDNQIPYQDVLYEIQGILQLQSGVSQLLKAQKQNSKRTYSLSAVEPIYCSTKKCYMMDLKGLISEPSSMNMVLKTSKNQDCLVFGKRSQNTFLMFVSTPLSLLQSFGIFLANYIYRK